MILNSHYELSCPSEHRLNNILKKLPELLTDYNKDLIFVNNSTSNRNLSLFNDEDLNSLAKYIIELALKRGGNKKELKYFGLKDNGIINNINLFIKIFPNEKFIFVLRDPRHVAISAWYHNIRVDKNFLNLQSNIDNWSIEISNAWAKNLDKNLQKETCEKIYINHKTYMDQYNYKVF